MDDNQTELVARQKSWIESTRHLELTSDKDFRDAATVRKQIKTELGGWDTLLSPNIDRQKENLRMSRKEKKDVETPLRELDANIKRSMEGWETRKLESQKSALEEVEEELRLRTEKQMEEGAIKLAEDGDYEGAIDAAQNSAFVSPLPQFVLRRTVTENSSTRMLKRYRVVDESKVKDKFKIESLDTLAIQRIVTHRFSEAEEIVGGIEVYEKPSVGVK